MITSEFGLKLVVGMHGSGKSTLVSNDIANSEGKSMLISFYKEPGECYDKAVEVNEDVFLELCTSSKNGKWKCGCDVKPMADRAKLIYSALDNITDGVLIIESVSAYVFPYDKIFEEKVLKFTTGERQGSVILIYNSFDNIPGVFVERWNQIRIHKTMSLFKSFPKSLQMFCFLSAAQNLVNRYIENTGNGHFYIEFDRSDDIYSEAVQQLGLTPPRLPALHEG